MEVLNSSVGADGKLEYVTLKENRDDRGQTPRNHVLMRNLNTGEFAYEIWECDPYGKPTERVYQNLTAHRSVR